MFTNHCTIKAASGVCSTHGGKNLDGFQCDKAKPSANATPQAKFCVSFEWRRPIHWIDLTGYLVLDADRRAIITLDSGTYHAHYRQFQVQIIHKQNGVLATKTFAFADYLKRKQKGGGKCDYFGLLEVCSETSWDWYMGGPETTKPICQAIEEYIDLFI